jgi:hypothetical protein
MRTIQQRLRSCALVVHERRSRSCLTLPFKQLSEIFCIGIHDGRMLYSTSLLKHSVAVNVTAAAAAAESNCYEYSHMRSLLVNY